MFIVYIPLNRNKEIRHMSEKRNKTCETQNMSLLFEKNKKRFWPNKTGLVLLKFIRYLFSATCTFLWLAKTQSFETQISEFRNSHLED